MPSIPESDWNSHLVARLKAARNDSALASELSACCSALTNQSLVPTATSVEHAHALWFGCSRAHALLDQASSWSDPVITTKSEPNKTDAVRGRLWRYVMAYSGWEQVGRSLLWQGGGAFGFDQKRLAPLADGLPLPRSPWPSLEACPQSLKDWLVGEASDDIAAQVDLEYLQQFFGIHGNNGAPFIQWLTGQKPDALPLTSLLAVLRNLVAHGTLSPSRAEEWRLTDCYEDGTKQLLRLARRAWGVLA